MKIWSKPACQMAARLTVFLASAIILLATGASAQDKAMMDAIKANCRSDYMANCMSVTPGGKEALQCLQKNLARLSPACSGAVSATMPQASPPPAAAAPSRPASSPPAAAKAPTPAPRQTAQPAEPAASQMDAINAHCRSDYMAKCGSVPPGGTEALRCMQRHVAGLSSACKTAVSATMPKSTPAAAKPEKAMTTTAAVPSSAPPPAGAIAPPAEPAISMAKVEAMPLPKRLAVMKSCSYDKNAVCPAMMPGGSRIVLCLAEHLQALSLGCKRALLGAIR